MRMPGSPFEARVNDVELFTGTLLIWAITPFVDMLVGVSFATGEPSVGVTCVLLLLPEGAVFAPASLPGRMCNAWATRATTSITAPPLSDPSTKLRLLSWRSCSSCQARYCEVDCPFDALLVGVG